MKQEGIWECEEEMGNKEGVKKEMQAIRKLEKNRKKKKLKNKYTCIKLGKRDKKDQVKGLL